jgi:hypothetical protein
MGASSQHPDRSIGWILIIVSVAAFSGAGWALGSPGQPIALSRVLASATLFATGVIVALYARTFFSGKGLSSRFWGRFGLALIIVGVLGGLGAVPALLSQSTPDHNNGVLALAAGLLIAVVGASTWLLARRRSVAR